MIKVSTELQGSHKDWDIFDESFQSQDAFDQAMSDLIDYLDDHDGNNDARGSFDKQVTNAVLETQKDHKSRNITLPLGVTLDAQGEVIEDQSHLDLHVHVKYVEEDS